jgi:hypothetical protein
MAQQQYEGHVQVVEDGTAEGIMNVIADYRRIEREVGYHEGYTAGTAQMEGMVAACIEIAMENQIALGVATAELDRLKHSYNDWVHNRLLPGLSNACVAMSGVIDEEMEALLTDDESQSEYDSDVMGDEEEEEDDVVDVEEEDDTPPCSPLPAHPWSLSPTVPIRALNTPSPVPTPPPSYEDIFPEL